MGAEYLDTILPATADFATFGLAVLGGFVALKPPEREDRALKWFYIISFILLAIIGISANVWQRTREKGVQADLHREQVDAEKRFAGDLQTVKSQTGAMVAFLSNPPKNLSREDIVAIARSWTNASFKASSTRELRETVHELAKQIRKRQSDHTAKIQSIEEYCKTRRVGPAHGMSCGIPELHDETVAFEKDRDDYLGQAISLRDAMLAKLPPQPQSEPDIETVDLADYLDGLAAKLP